MIDYHCHLLPGLDDGARSLDDSLAMARGLLEGGFTDVYCTPHCMRGCYDHTSRQVRAAVGDLQAELTRAGLPLQVHPGMEYYLDEYFLPCLDDALPLGETRLLLVEAPSQIAPEFFLEQIFGLIRKGYVPLVAHPERVSWLAEGFARQEKYHGAFRRLFSRSPSPPGSTPPAPHLQALKNLGCFFQGNLGAFSGYYGRQVRESATKLLAAGVYHYFGSDAHRPETLPKILEGLQYVNDGKGRGRGGF